MIRKLAIYFIFFFIGLLNCPAEKIPAPPDPPTLVVDKADLLTDEQEAILEQRLEKYEDSTTIEIAIVTLTSIGDYKVEEYANKLFNKWKIGKKDKNNGLLILIVRETHDVRIEVGYGLESTITSIFAKNVIDEYLVPKFKEGRFYEGLQLGIDQLTYTQSYEASQGYGGMKDSFSLKMDDEINKMLAKHFEDRERKNRGSNSGWIILVLFLIGIVGSFLRARQSINRYYNYSRNGRRNGFYYVDDNDGQDGWFGGGSSSYSSGSGSSGSSSSGFGGFGGGSSGGGGASGKW